MRDSLGFELALSGFLASAPQLLLCMLTMVSAFLADWLRARCFSTGTVRKLFTSLGLGASATGKCDLASDLGIVPSCYHNSFSIQAATDTPEPSRSVSLLCRLLHNPFSKKNSFSLNSGRALQGGRGRPESSILAFCGNSTSKQRLGCTPAKARMGAHRRRSPSP